jgi:hypothetical protein
MLDLLGKVVFITCLLFCAANFVEYFRHHGVGNLVVAIFFVVCCAIKIIVAKRVRQ